MHCVIIVCVPTVEFETSSTCTMLNIRPIVNNELALSVVLLLVLMYT